MGVWQPHGCIFRRQNGPGHSTFFMMGNSQLTMYVPCYYWCCCYPSYHSIEYEGEISSLSSNWLLLGAGCGMVVSRYHESSSRFISSPLCTGTGRCTHLTAAELV